MMQHSSRNTPDDCWNQFHPALKDLYYRGTPIKLVSAEETRKEGVFMPTIDDRRRKETVAMESKQLQMIRLSTDEEQQISFNQPRPLETVLAKQPRVTQPQNVSGQPPVTSTGNPSEVDSASQNDLGQPPDSSAGNPSKLAPAPPKRRAPSPRVPPSHFAYNKNFVNRVLPKSNQGVWALDATQLDERK